MTGVVESSTRARTRHAILSAAAATLVRDRSATLAQIADAAGVGRSTLRRYFAERDDLHRAVVADSLERMGTAVGEAAIDQGPPRDALRRLVAAMVSVGDQLLLLFGDQTVRDSLSNDDPEDRSVIELFERGQADGVFDPEVSAEWLQHVLWSLVYTACDDVSTGALPRHAVTATVIRTMENGIRARVKGDEG